MSIFRMAERLSGRWTVSQGYCDVRGFDEPQASGRKLARRDGIDPGDVSRILPLAFLAPDIVEAILGGRQPIDLTATRLKRIPNLPLEWAAQRQLLGFT